jgi:hypothetical protein
MSIEKTGSRTDDLLSGPDLSRPGPDPSGPVPTDPATTRPRLRRALTAGASRVRQSAPHRLRQAGGAVRQNPAPSAGVLALVGGVIAVLLVRRRAARSRAAQARNRWVPARFQR